MTDRPMIPTHLRHRWFKCPGNHDGRYCQFCDGDLGLCKVCDGFEGACPTHCPGEKLTRFQKDLIYGGLIDFKGGDWVIEWDTIFRNVKRKLQEELRKEKCL